MVINPVNIEIEGLEKAKEKVYSEIDIYKEGAGISPITYNPKIKVISDSPHTLPEELRNRNIVLKLWIGSKETIDIIDSENHLDGGNQKEKYKKFDKKQGFHDVELQEISLNLENFQAIADILENIGSCLENEGYKINYFKLQGEVEEESFRLAIERLKNRIFPGIRIENKDEIKIDIEYEPFIENKKEYIIRPIVLNRENQYNIKETERVKNNIIDILKINNFPTP